MDQTNNKQSQNNNQLLNNNNVDPQINHIAVKIPPFYYNSPKIWFRQIEANFDLARITVESTKINYIIANLPEEVAIQLEDNFESYEMLKNNIIEAYQKNKIELIEEALGNIELGNRKPSALLTDMKNKFKSLGINGQEEMIRHKFLKALPSEIAAHLISEENLEASAKIADSLIAFRNIRSNEICAMNSSSSRSNYPNTPKPPKPDQRQKICNAHIYYASRAKYCRHWCQWPGAKPQLTPPGQRTPRQMSPTRNSPNA